MLVQVEVGQTFDRDEFLRQLIGIQYDRTESDLERRKFRVRGNLVDVYPSYGEQPYRIQFLSDKIAKIVSLEGNNYKEQNMMARLAIYPAKHFVTTSERIEQAVEAIKKELAEQVKALLKQDKDLEAKRLESRTRYDLEMLQEVGYTSGIENYSRHLSGRAPGSKPYTLIDYFPKGFLTIIDECHQSIPQIRAMFKGDQARKKTLVEYGFRLPSALDNRPLNFAEFERAIGQLVYVSATPSAYELDRTDQIVEQINRPTGLLDPEVEIRQTEGQIDDLMAMIKARAKKNERTLVTTLTKRMAEDLSRYLKEVGVKCHYLHSDFDAFERVEVLKNLRERKFDCIIGINLLREGLDLPEVSLVAILDADKEGFLRSAVSLIQIMGRTARHIHGKVIMYADRTTDSMKKALDETGRRRKIQEAYNQKHNITPQSVKKEIKVGIERWKEAEKIAENVIGETEETYEAKSHIAYLYNRMLKASNLLDFEQAAKLRDRIRELESEHGLDAESSLKKKAKKSSRSNPRSKSKR